MHWTPPAWAERDRSEAIEVPKTTKWRAIEGAGAARPEFADHIDAAVRIASDPDTTRARELAYDGDDPDTVAFIEEWAAAEGAFIVASRPWERADLVACGTPAAPATHGCVAVATSVFPKGPDGSET